MSKIGKSIVDMAVTAKDAVKDVVMGKPKKAKSKSAAKAAKPAAKKKATPTKKVGAAKKGSSVAKASAAKKGSAATKKKK